MIEIYPTNNRGTQLKYSSMVFNGGEVQVKLDGEKSYDTISQLMRIHLVTNIENSNDIMELFLLTDALRQINSELKISVTIKYFPYARQDRVMTYGQSLSVLVMTQLINSQNYSSVEVWDPHSDVTPALLNNCKIKEQYEFLLSVPLTHGDLFVAPDAGALKKVYKAADCYGMNVIRADKTRDLTTGHLSNVKVYSDHLGSKDLFILDDICDGGRTFINLAKELRKITDGKIYLYVTHGIFSQGLDVFDGIIDKIYCPNVFSKVERKPILVEI